MSIAKWLIEEIEAVTPARDGRMRETVRPAKPLDDDDMRAILPPPLQRRGHHGGLLIRDRVVAILAEHSPLAQREVFVRVWRQLPDLHPPSVRSQVSAALLQLEEREWCRRCAPPKDAWGVWWEVTP